MVLEYFNPKKVFSYDLLEREGKSNFRIMGEHLSVFTYSLVGLSLIFCAGVYLFPLEEKKYDVKRSIEQKVCLNPQDKFK